MSKITHYEVYSNRGDGWKLEQRFSSEEREAAFKLAKELGDKNVAVRVNKESYNVDDNTYTDSVEHVRGLQKVQASKKDKTDKNFASFIVSPQSSERSLQRDIIGALLKIIAIIVLCLIFANVVITLLDPIIELIAKETHRKPIMFVLFFFFFLSAAVPLILNKVPWHVFVNRLFPTAPVNEKKFLRKAALIERRYSLDDTKGEIFVPVFPSAAIEDKKYIVDFLGSLVRGLERPESISNSFSKLGIKFAVYGGCLELSRHKGLNMPQANSLLYEAFNIIDGEKTDLEGFYEAKRAYKDNRYAIFLSGVGAYLMAQVIKNIPLDTKAAKLGFDRWENQLKENAPEPKKAKDELKALPCILCFNRMVQLADSEDNDGKDELKDVKAQTKKLLSQISKKSHGEVLSETEYLYAVKLSNPEEAAAFATGFFNDFEDYFLKINDENLHVENKCFILSESWAKKHNLLDLAADILYHIYDGEIIIDAEIKDRLKFYETDFLGSKKLEKIDKTEELFRLIY